MKKTKNVAENVAENALTLYGTNSIFGYDNKEKTFRGVKISNALATELSHYIAAELKERQAKIVKGIALWTIKTNALAPEYETDENGKPYAKQNGKYTKAARDKMFNRFTKELGIPQSTVSRLIRCAEICSKPTFDSEGNIIKLVRIPKVEYLPESVIMYAEEHKFSKENFEQFIAESETLDFKGVSDFLPYWQTFTAKLNGKAGIATTEQDSKDSKDSKINDSTSDVPISILGDVNYKYEPYMSLKGKYYLPVPIEVENPIVVIAETLHSKFENTISELSINEVVTDTDITLLIVSYYRINSKGEKVYKALDTFYHNNTDTAPVK